MANYADKDWNKLLKFLAGRDAPVELSRRDAQSDGPPMIYRSRLFEVQADGSIIVERPSHISCGTAFANRDDIELLLIHNGERLVATCTVLETFIQQINPTVRVTCYKLSPGRRPMRDQRRTFYRVNVAGLPLDPVILESKDEDAPFLIKGKLVNLSGGGFGVSVRADAKLLGQIKRTRCFRCTAVLDDGHAIAAPVRVSHISQRSEDLIYLGLQTEIEDETYARAVEDELLHHCARFQRLQLQRRKA